jgi:glycosyltransferase involved in cell wall biosynthesis
MPFNEPGVSGTHARDVASMKCLVFAHVPPPRHGQSQMVEYLVDGLRSRPELGVEIIHVDARLSSDLMDVGSARGGKLGRLFKYCLLAITARLRTGVRVLYYIPSPPKRNSLYRDWLVMGMLRLFYPIRVFHWEAVGLGAWVQGEASAWERWISRKLLGGAKMSIALTPANEVDAQYFQPKETVSISNAVADPFINDESKLAEKRRTRWIERRVKGGEVNVLFLALCTEDKGVLDAVETVVLANQQEKQRTQAGMRFKLRVAGTFPDVETERRFQARVNALQAQDDVEYVGFLEGKAKAEALWAADMFLFPTCYSAEGQPLNLMEACAAGLPIVSTLWRGIPEMFWEEYRGLVAPKDPCAGAMALCALARDSDPMEFRVLYKQRFSLESFCQQMAVTLRRAGEVLEKSQGANRS